MNPKKFAKNFKKSYDYPNSKVIIDAKDQDAAERTVPSSILSKLGDANERPDGEIASYKFQKGILTLAKKESNLFSGFFTDSAGQIVEKFDAHTIELVAKTLLVKDYLTDLDINGEAPELKPVVAPIVVEPKTQILIRVGDVEIELRKSIRDFVTEFKKDKSSALMQKALSSWRRGQKFQSFETNVDAAKEILDNWETHKESFNQTLFAIKQLEKKK